jgi:hypothetical protein
MKINLKVELSDGKTQEVVCSAPDLVKFEDKYNISVARLESEMKLTHLLFLAHASLSRQKQTTLSFDEWLETVGSVGAGVSDPK